jgi:hypothetical protein
VTSQGGNRRAEDDITVYLGKYQKNEGWNMDRGVQSFTVRNTMILKLVARTRYKLLKRSLQTVDITIF